MKTIFHKISTGIAAIFLLWLGSCKVDTLEDIKGLEPTVSLVQTGSGQVTLKPEDLAIDKANLVLRKTLGIAYAGYEANQSFTVNITLDLSGAPDGYEPFAAGECFITTEAGGKNPVASIEVPGGAKSRAFYFNVTKAAIDARPGKKLAAKIRISDASLYKLNHKADSVLLLMDMSNFGSLKVDVTANYLKNTGFVRAPGTTDRFASLADWLSNDAVKNSRPQGAGFDANFGKFGIERWSGGDKPIINGKIYQTFNLPKGNYQIEVAMANVKPDRDTYLAVASGASLPDDVQIGTAIASKMITADFNQNTLALPFTNPSDQQVTVGFLLNFDQGTQKILQASAIKMFRIESLFD